MAFAGAVSALLVNLDRYELPQGRRTPLGHSLAAMALWTYIAAMSLVALAEAGALGHALLAPMVAGISTGYATHLALDIFSDEGVYLFPNKLFPALASLPEGCARQWAGWYKFCFLRGNPGDVPANT